MRGRTLSIRSLNVRGILAIACCVGYFMAHLDAGQSVQESKSNKSDKDLFKPLLDQSTLVVGKTSLKPIVVDETWQPSYTVGDHSLLVSGDSVVAQDKNTREVIWSAKAADGCNLSFLGANNQTAFVVGFEVRDGRFAGYVKPLRIRRLDLNSGLWLSDLDPIKDWGATYSPQDDVTVFSDEHNVVVLTLLAALGDDSKPSENAFALTCFAEGEAAPIWSKLIPAHDTRPYTGGYLLAAQTPQYAASAINRLSKMDERLLVCAEARQPILCLNIDTGTELWRCERIWEFERGFIGPSVWEHFIDRFGIESDVGGDKKEIAAAQEKFNDAYQCSVIGGPIAIPLDFKRDEDSHSVFIAVSRERAAEAFSGYLADCVVYELSSNGEPISIAKLPQMVSGASFDRFDGGLFWKCHNDGLLKLLPSRHSRRHQGGPGGPDLLTRISWFRQYHEKQIEGWLVAGRSGNPFAFGDGIAARTAAGGFVAENGDAVFQFPISIIELESGDSRELMLKVPFQGEVTIPTTNFGTSRLGNGQEGIRTIGPWLLDVTQLAFDGKQLEVTLGMTDSAATVAFNLDEIELFEGDHLYPDHGIDNSSNGNDAFGAKPDDSALLFNATKDIDTRRLQQLLSSGANLNARSDHGRTPLMEAADDGTAEAVYLLVKAGADVNARNGQYHDMTVLMSAAYSGRESKRKVRILVDAGADLALLSDNGWNVLMIAAQRGNVETVEYLLSKGLDVRATNGEGKSVLMVATGSRSLVLMSVLIKAGADVNARDDNGMTALMVAAEGYDEGEGLQVLLDAGADPFQKDHDGRTALDLTTNLNHSGAEQRATLLKSVMKR